MEYGYGQNYQTNYGATGAADGGGFIGGEPQSSQTGGKGSGGKETIRPVTIKQILEAHQPHPEADFKVDGEVIPQVTFVGQIRNISTQITNITYKVDDGTGIIEVKQWVDGDATQDEMDTSDTKRPKLVEDGYCRVWGKLKAFNNKRHVGSHVIRPITDYNEINYHMLEATAIHLFFKYGPPTSNQSDGPSKGAGQDQYNAGGQDASGDGRPVPGHLSPRAKMVYKWLRDRPSTNEGMHVQMIASGMSMEVNEVYKAGEELLAAGLTFTTVDDNTWAVLDYE